MLEDAKFALLEARIERLERTVQTMAHWLYEAQTGFGERDVRGIERLLKEPLDVAEQENA